MNEQKTNDLILQTATKLVSFIILLFSFYLFLSGHNAPGGGFVGGLITSSSIVLLLLAYDLKTVRSLLPVNFIYVAGSRPSARCINRRWLLCLRGSFLTHTFGYFQLPILGKTELATATIFDLGVYLVVVGITMTIIQTIGEEE
nr:Na(+)/H(+) antiporter subunit B [Bacillus subtilis]